VLYRVPSELPFEHAAMVEPFAIALHAIRRSPPLLNDTVVVLGAGMIGLALVQALSRAGCGRLISVDIADDRLEMAKKFGATQTINSGKQNAIEEILALTHGPGADVAFEAVGVTATVDLALRCLRKGGAATLVGNVAPKIEFPLQTAVTRELSVHGSCASRGEYPACLDMLSRGELNAAPLISKTAPLAEGASWFDRLYRKEPGLLKVILKP
jgi:L-iditol 2-dehydrogenase